jgi:phosphatidylglycerol---prolipoprotein diacylglyceryl transferase
MHPELFTIGGYTLKSYALACAVAMLAALLPVRAEAKRLGWGVEASTWLVMKTTLAGWVGAHVLYVITRLDLPSEAFWKLVPRFGSGSVWYGGFLSSTLYVLWYARRNRIALLAMCDVGAFAALVAQSVGRLGCLLAGCCYGLPTDLPWGIHVPHVAHAVHPTMLYEALLLAALFAGLWRRRCEARPGETAALYLLVTPCIRFSLEFLRGDSIRGFVWGTVSTSQFIALWVIAAGAALYYWVWSRPRVCHV